MISIIIAAILGGVFSFIYGGNALGFIGKKFGSKWEKRFNVVDKLIYYVFYAITVSFFLPIFAFVPAVLNFGAQWARRAVSWGKYRGALIHGRIGFNSGKGVEFIDELIFADGEDIDYIKLRCIAALGIIGAAGGFILALALMAGFAVMNAPAPLELFWLIPGLAVSGVFYWAGAEIAGLVFGQHEGGRNKGWPIGEVLEGSYMWGFVAVVLVGAV